MNAGSDPSGEPKTAPLHVAPPSSQPAAGGAAPDHTAPTASLASGGKDACPTCGEGMAPDQRYCLNCGHRRGDPRLPFMDAVVFMDAVKQPHGSGEAPPPPAKQGSGISPGTTLIAGVATLILAVGVGVLIGHSGNNGSAPVANQAPQIIKVGGSSGGEETETANNGAKEKTAKAGKSKKGGKKGSKSEAPELETGASGASKASEEVLKPSADAKPLPPPTTKVGESCKKGTAGCSESGEFNGSFFGE